jgi:hypothetical protein
VSQPGVSAQIRRLERELGQELLDRSGRSVRLTEVGVAVLPYARYRNRPVASAQRPLAPRRPLAAPEVRQQIGEGPAGRPVCSQPS